MKPPRIFVIPIVFLISAVPLSHAQEKPPTAKYFEQYVAASNPLRADQAKELDAYILQMKQDPNRLHEVFKPDYSSPAAFAQSAEPYRKAFCDSIGYPPPGAIPIEEPKFEQIGEDSIATYYRATIPILPQIHAEGIYIVPKNLAGKAPLIISMHGGGGSPEVALFHGGANYHDMVRGGAKRGYVVFAPQHP